MCNNCPLFGRPKVLGHGNRQSGLAIVGEAPGKTEASQGRPLVGTSGRLLRGVLQQACPGIDPWITTACLCLPETEILPPEAIQACRPRLLEELKGMKKVLLCGSTAVTSLVPEQGKITTCRGRAFYSDELGSTILVSTYHPAKILRNPSDFPDFVKDIVKWAESEGDISPPPLPQIRICQSLQDIQNMYTIVRKDGVFSCDIETTGLDPLTDRILLIGIQSRRNLAWQIPETLFSQKGVIHLLTRFFSDRSIFSIGQNSGSFDSKFLLSILGIDWRPDLDTMLAHYSLDERQGGHGLDSLTKDYLNFPDYKREIGEELKKISTDRQKEMKAAQKSGIDLKLDPPTFADLPQDFLSRYLARDTQGTLLLAEPLLDEMEKEGVRRVHDDLLLPAALALREIELTGISLNTDYLINLQEQMKSELAVELRILQELARKLGVPELNPNSPKQVAELLYDRLRIPTKSRSTDRETLENLQGKFPIVKQILDCRQKDRIVGTYVNGLLDRVSSDGRIHGDFLLHGTVTGRLSSRDPNLQNIPVLIGPMIRNAFVATPGWEMIEADYNQLELRVAAWYSRDPLLLHYYQNDFDVHRMVASEVFNVPPEEVTQLQRYIAKYIDFGIIYGRQASSLAYGELKCSVQKAQEYIDSFLSKFQGLAEWMSEVRAQVLQEGFIATPFGRRRRFPLVLDSNRGEVLRQAVNSPIQSMASDLCLTALTRLHRRLDPRHARILLTVHDSILFEARTGQIERTMRIIREEMEDNCPISSPITFKIDQKQGDRWGSLDKRLT